MRILVLGGTGLLGSSLCPYLKSRGYDVAIHGSGAQYEADCTNSNELATLLLETSPNFIINLISLTNVDYCESNAGEAYLINGQIAKNISDWIIVGGRNTNLVQISTDQVYGDNGNQAESNVMPRNYYAYSKYMGELYSERASAAILRVNFFGRSLCEKRESFTDWLYRLAKNNETIFAFKDVYFSALCISTLVKMIEAVLINFKAGTFNIGSKDGLSKFEFAKYFLEDLGFSTENILPRNVGELEFLKAYRPRDMRMNVTLFEDAFNICLPTLKDEIKKAAGEYDQNTK